MGKNLVIVEAPTKAKTIGKILGPDFIVKSSLGHVRDLPERRLGVDIEHGFQPKYEVPKSKVKVIDDIVKAAKGCETIYLAPDPDREGEAIAWHLRQLLESSDATHRFFRVQYNEITPQAVRAAFANPGEIDQARVDAQQSRRVLDRIVGYMVSPMLWRQIRRGLSAGRVQSVALRLVCERERAIQDFIPDVYWILGVLARKLTAPLEPFRLRLAAIDGKKADVRDEAGARAVLDDLRGATLRVDSVRRREVRKRPPPPFITSTLQQSASSVCGFSPGRTMRIAQQLYEGIDLGDGAIGLITYMRTDSVHVAREAQASALAFLRDRYGAEFCPDKPNVYKGRDHAQEAHEAIRPTDVTVTPDQLPASLGAPERKLYDLIWRRFLASQMTPARFDQRTVEVVNEPRDGAPSRYRFSASSSALLFPGYMRVSGAEARLEGDKDDEDGDRVDALPPLSEGEPLACLDLMSERKETKPPPRFSEASLVRELEANGIGRPSTYASIIETLHQRLYIQREKRSLSPTDLGVQANTLLVEKLPALFDVGFTAEMEASLDRVERGEVKWTDMLEAFYKDFSKWLEAAREPGADMAVVHRALDLLGQVKEWAPERKRGRRTFSDRKFVESVATQASGDRGISQRQLDALLRLLMRYREQIEGAGEYLNSLGRDDLLQAPELQPPRESTHQKLALLNTIELGESDRAFVTSLAEQVDGGRRLSDAQVAALDTVVASVRDHISNYDAVRESLGIAPPDAAAEKECHDLLAALSDVQQWREATKRGKREFDDRVFFESLREQFQRRRSLTPRQRAALRKLVSRYRAQITTFDRLNADYALVSRDGSRGAAKKEPETS